MVDIWIPLGIIIAVMRFSMLVISEKAITSFSKTSVSMQGWNPTPLYQAPYIGNPSKDIGIEAYMIFGNVNVTLQENFLLERTCVIWKELNFMHKATCSQPQLLSLYLQLMHLFLVHFEITDGNRGSVSR